MDIQNQTKDSQRIIVKCTCGHLFCSGGLYCITIFYKLQNMYSLLSRDVTSILSVQMVVKGKWQGKLLLQNIYMYMIVMTLEVVYDHFGKSRKLALCYLIQINLRLFCLTTIWKSEMKQKVTWLKPKNTETYGPARDACQQMRTRDFTGSSMCLYYLVGDLVSFCNNAYRMDRFFK